MPFTCKNCGAIADDSSKLCSPTNEELSNKFCGASALHVCNAKVSAMKYSCDACGSVSADAQHLCTPSEMK